MIRISDAEIDRWLAEDLPYGDLTTQSLGVGSASARMDFRAGADLVLSGVEEAGRIIERLGGRVHAAALDGTALAEGEAVLTAEGSAAALLAAWKVAQTLTEYASGIATAARQIVNAARSVTPTIAVACTRKTFPGTKAMAVKAVLAGGAVLHRLGLSETVLVFPEHRAFLQGRALGNVIAGLRRVCPEKKIVVEVTSLEDAEGAAHAGADVIQLEKFSPHEVHHAVEHLGETGVTIAAAGGITAANAADYAAAGAQVLVTSAPYAAKPLDIKVTIAPR